MKKDPNEKLDYLLDKVNELQDGRHESDIGLSDKYWEALNEYRVELSKNDGKHIPVGSVKEDKPKEAVTFSDSVNDQLKAIGQ